MIKVRKKGRLIRKMVRYVAIVRDNIYATNRNILSILCNKIKKCIVLWALVVETLYNRESVPLVSLCTQLYVTPCATLHKVSEGHAL